MFSYSSRLPLATTTRMSFASATRASRANSARWAAVSVSAATDTDTLTMLTREVTAVRSPRSSASAGAEVADPYRLTPHRCRIGRMVASGAMPTSPVPGTGRAAMIPATAVPWAAQSVSAPATGVARVTSTPRWTAPRS